MLTVELGANTRSFFSFFSLLLMKGKEMLGAVETALFLIGIKLFSSLLACLLFVRCFLWVLLPRLYLSLVLPSHRFSFLKFVIVAGLDLSTSQSRIV